MSVAEKPHDVPKQRLRNDRLSVFIRMLNYARKSTVQIEYSHQVKDSCYTEKQKRRNLAYNSQVPPFTKNIKLSYQALLPHQDHQ